MKFAATSIGCCCCPAAKWLRLRHTVTLCVECANDLCVTTVCVHPNHKSFVRLIICCLCSVVPSVSSQHCILRMARRESSFQVTNFGFSFASLLTIFCGLRHSQYECVCVCLANAAPEGFRLSSTHKPSHFRILQTMMLLSMSTLGSISISQLLAPCYYCSIVSGITIAFSYKL